jgi:hypothetical protein
VEMVNARPVRSRPRLMQLGRLGPRALSTLTSSTHTLIQPTQRTQPYLVYGV